MNSINHKFATSEPEPSTPAVPLTALRGYSYGTVLSPPHVLLSHLQGINTCPIHPVFAENHSRLHPSKPISAEQVPPKCKTVRGRPHEGKTGSAHPKDHPEQVFLGKELCGKSTYQVRKISRRKKETTSGQARLRHVFPLDRLHASSPNGTSWLHAFSIPTGECAQRFSVAVMKLCWIVAYLHQIGQ